jgi:hypothetical protein
MGSATGDNTVAEALDRMGERVQTIDRKLRTFAANASVLSSEHSRLAARYQNKWIAVHEGEVAAAADTLEQLKHELAAKRISASDAAVEFIDTNPKTLIL